MVRFAVWYCPLETVYLQPGIQSGGWLEGEDFLSRYYCSLKTCTSNVIRFLSHLNFQIYFVFCLNYCILNHLKYGRVQDMCMCDSLVNKASLMHNFFFSMFISFHNMFRATTCSSSGETTIFMRHCMDDCLVCTLNTRQSSIQNNEYQVSHRYSCFSWWCAHSRPKHVEKRNKNTKKNCAPSWLYLQDYTRTQVNKT